MATDKTFRDPYRAVLPGTSNGMADKLRQEDRARYLDSASGLYACDDEIGWWSVYRRGMCYYAYIDINRKFVGPATSERDLRELALDGPYYVEWPKYSEPASRVITEASLDACDELPDVMGVPAVAEALHISEATVRWWIRSGMRVRRGKQGAHMIKVGDLRAFLRTRGKEKRRSRRK